MPRAAIVALALVASCAAPLRAAPEPGADRLYREGTEARKAERLEDAVALLTRAAETQPGNADVWLQLGLARSGQGRYQDARHALLKALVLAPSYADARLALVRLALFENRPDEAERELAVLRERSPNLPEADELARRVATARGEASEEPAPPALRGSQTAGSENAERLRREGQAAYRSGQLQRAINLLTQLRDLEPDNADTLVPLGSAFAAARRYEEAKGAFKRALERAPAYADALVGLARVAFFQGDLERAEQKIAAALDKAQGNAEAKALQAQIAAAKATSKGASGKNASPAEAVSSAHKNARGRTALDRTEAAAGLGRSLDQAKALRRSRRFAEAEALYRETLRAQPRDVDLWVSAGAVTAFQGPTRYGDARRDFGRALGLDPRSTDAKLGLARLDLYEGALAAAERQVAEVLAQSPASSEAQALAGRIRLARDDPQGAEAAFRQIAAREARDVEALLGLGDALRAQLRDGEALAVYERAATLDATSSEVRDRLKSPIRPRWRLDLEGSYSDLTGGNEPWREGSARLSYDLNLRTTLSGDVEVSERFSKRDVLVSARVDQRWSDRWTGYLRLGGTPDADFRPEVFAEGGGSVRLRAGGDVLGPTLATVDFGFARYPAVNVVTVSPGLQQFFLDGRIWFTAKAIGTLADQRLPSQPGLPLGQGGTQQFGGYLLRADIKAADRLTLFAGYADAPDSSDGRVFQVRSVFGGAILDLDHWVSLKLSAAHEMRVASYDRTTMTFGVTTRF